MVGHRVHHGVEYGVGHGVSHGFVHEASLVVAANDQRDKDSITVSLFTNNEKSLFLRQFKSQYAIEPQETFHAQMITKYKYTYKYKHIYPIQKHIYMCLLIK